MPTVSTTTVTTDKRNHHRILNEQLVSTGKSHNVHELEQLILNTPSTDFNEINCATACSVLGKARSRNQQCWDKLLQEVAPGKRFETRELTNLCHGLASARLAQQHKKMPQFVSDQLSSSAALPPRALSNILWSYATLGDASQAERFASMITRTSNSNGGVLKDMNAQDTSNTLWAFAKLGYVHDAKLNAAVLGHLAQMDLQAFNAQGLSNTLWALATTATATASAPQSALTQQVAAKFAKELLKKDARALPGLLPKHVATCVWALSVLSAEPEPDLLLLGAFADEVQRRAQSAQQLTQFSSHDLAQLCAAFAKLGGGSREILPLLADDITRRGLHAHFNEHDVCSIAWAFASAQLPAPSLFAQLKRINVDGGGSGVVSCPRTVSTLLWSVARLGVPDSTQFVTRLCARAALLLLSTNFSPRERAMTLWSLGKLQHEDAALCERLLVVSNGDAFGSPRDVANTAHALAVLGHPVSAEVARTLARAVLASWPQFAFQDVCNTVWAFACMGQGVLELAEVRQVFQLSLPEGVFNQSSPSINQQLAHVRLALQPVYESRLVEHELKPRRCGIEVNAISKVHMLVHDMLKPALAPAETAEEQYDVKFEHELVPESSLFVDLFVVVRRSDGQGGEGGGGVVIEVDGPMHHFSNHADRPTGKTLFRDRLILQQQPKVKRLIKVHSTQFWNSPDKEAHVADLVRQIREG